MRLLLRRILLLNHRAKETHCIHMLDFDIENLRIRIDNVSFDLGLGNFLLDGDSISLDFSDGNSISLDFSLGNDLLDGDSISLDFSLGDDLLDGNSISLDFSLGNVLLDGDSINLDFSLGNDLLGSGDNNFRQDFVIGVVLDALTAPTTQTGGTNVILTVSTVGKFLELVVHAFVDTTRGLSIEVLLVALGAVLVVSKSS
jgi:hypothetical protein